ncbi:MAG: DUF4258 domain-containing protein [Patescibacteria group bacterium]
MNLKFSIHFQQAIVERNISIDHLKKTIKNPDTLRQSFGDRMIAAKAINDKVLEVVYIKRVIPKVKSEFVIITAYYLLKK